MVKVTIMPMGFFAQLGRLTICSQLRGLQQGQPFQYLLKNIDKNIITQLVT